MACGKLVLAASAVLTFALVAIRIHVSGQCRKTAPITKATTMYIPANVFHGDNTPNAAQQLLQTQPTFCILLSKMLKLGCYITR